MLSTMDADAVERLIHDCEELLAVRITVHDLIGALRDADGHPLLSALRQSHRGHPACARGFDARCIAHCRGAVNAAVAASRLPLVQSCWKGLVEIAVPVHRGGIHVLTLFAGPWRPATGGITPPAAIAKLYPGLPVLNEARTDAIGRILHVLGSGLLARLAESEHEPVSRRAEIIAFFRYHDPQADGLAELAARLDLSRSRTSRLVLIATGRTFADLQTTARIARAKSLLLSTTLTAADIAERAGFADPYHFNRVFRRVVGTTPGRFRRDPEHSYSTGPVPLLAEPAARGPSYERRI